MKTKHKVLLAAVAVAMALVPIIVIVILALDISDFSERNYVNFRLIELDYNWRLVCDTSTCTLEQNTSNAIEPLNDVRDYAIIGKFIVGHRQPRGEGKPESYFIVNMKSRAHEVGLDKSKWGQRVKELTGGNPPPLRPLELPRGIRPLRHGS